ncbi:MAG: tryptophan halogenase family protein [Pseudomonadota bacterium]
MHQPEPTRVLVVGGGTAGWLAAASLARLLGPAARVELVESEAIGTVGVGEATIPQIRLLLGVLGINELDFMRHTSATIKLGIQFEGWGVPDSAYMHAFGATGRALGHAPFHHYWLRAQDQGLPSDLWDYSPNLQAARQNRYASVAPDPKAGHEGLVHAYHFDASKVAVYLRRYAEHVGVKRHEGRIVETRLRPEDGFIGAVCLEDGRALTADLFIDCTGFRGLLIEEALGAGFEDWSHFLPCDRAVAVQCEGTKPLVPYTRAIARDAGWQWRIPLQHRTGNGHVFCSAHMSEDEATETLLKGLDGDPTGTPRVIRFTTGMRKQFWKHNCVALGLASGFMEPLESTSIHLVQSGVDRLVKLFPGPQPDPATITEYNRQTRREFELIRDFLVLHYHANQRQGTFWTACRSMALPDGLQHKLAMFRATGGIFREPEDLFAEEAWLQVMIGQGITPEAWHPMADRLPHEQLARFMSQQKRSVQSLIGGLSPHSEFIARHCAE